ncbi:MAG: flagellar biosynthesis anti-sigma factor FlgM [Bryobacteraceae bacterium]
MLVGASNRPGGLHAMKIDDRNQIGAPATQGPAGAEHAEGRSAKSLSAEAHAHDHASLSRISEALHNDSTTRAAKVEKLRTEVVAGRYHADASDISRRLVQQALADSAAAGEK